MILANQARNNHGDGYRAARRVSDSTSGWTSQTGLVQELTQSVALTAAANFEEGNNSFNLSFRGL